MGPYRIIGENLAAQMVAATLKQGGFAVVPPNHDAPYTITLVEDPALTAVVLDSVDCELERHLLQHLRELLGRVEIQHAGGNQRDDIVVINLPATPDAREGVRRAVLRAADNFSTAKAKEQTAIREAGPTPPLTSIVRLDATPAVLKWAAIIAGILGLSLILASVAHAQPAPSFKHLDANTDGAVDSRVFIGLFTPASGGPTAVALPTTLGAGGGFKVDCMAGCSGSSFADNAAFTFGTTVISIVGGVLDDVASNAASENSAAAARITAQRAVHVNLRDAAGAEVAVGGGTQYTEDAPAAANPVGTALNMVRADALGALTSADGDNVAARGTDKGELYVKHADAIAVTNAGLTELATAIDTEMQVDIVAALPAGANAIGKLAANSGVDIGDVDVTSIAAGNNNIGDVDVASIAAGDTNIGNVDVVSLPALASGTNLVGRVQLDAAAANGGTPHSHISVGVTEDEHAVCTAACNLYSVTVTNTNAAVRYLKCENDTAANTAPGTDIPEFRIGIPAATTGSGFTVSFPVGAAFSTALTCWLVTGAADADVAEVAANEILVFYTFKQ